MINLLGPKTLAIPARLLKADLTPEEKEELSQFGDQPMTADEIAARKEEVAASAIDAPIVQAKQDAVEALEKSDVQILRCIERNIPVPTEWAEYRAVLRLIAKTGMVDIPNPPDYPAGT